MTHEQKLVGLDLMSVTLTKGATSFEFSGKIDGEFHRYDCGTGFDICFDEVRIFKDDIVNHPSTLRIWECLENKLSKLVLSDDGRVCSLTFEEGPSIYIWSRERDHDNLIIARRWQSDEWFTIG